MWWTLSYLVDVHPYIQQEYQTLVRIYALFCVLKTRGLIKAMFFELASSSSSSSSASSSSLDVYVTPKRIIYERYILGEVSDETSPTYAQLEDGLARIGVTVDMYNNGTTLKEAE